MVYHYKAESTLGGPATGVTEADPTFTAPPSLRRQGQLMTRSSISTDRTFTGNYKRTGSRKKVPKTELLMLTSQLSIMCESGVDLAEAIEESARQATHPVLRKALIQVHRDISDGRRIADAMAAQSEIFGSTYVASFSAGESSGNMETVLRRLAAILEGEIRLRSMLVTVMAYPVVLAGLSFVTLGVLLLFVLPHFGAIFEGMKVPLPASTQILLGLSNSFTEYPEIWCLSLLGGIATAVLCSRSPAVHRKFDHLMLHMTGVSDVTQSLVAGRAFRMCGTMVESGVPLLEAIRMTRLSIQNSVFRELFDVLETEVLNGRGIGNALAATKYIPRGAARMVVTAEKTGRLGQVMDRAGTFYETEGKRRLEELSKLLEPAIIIIMGCVVALVVLSILLPMFALTQMTGAN